MGTSNPYASNKAILHMDRLLAIRAGEPTTPVHMHFVVSDLCNQSCFAAGTMIECHGVKKPIESLRVGDTVVGPDGRDVRITVVGSRIADDLHEVRVGGSVLHVTAEHPLLTQDGWKEVKDLSPGRDRAVVRMRMRTTDEMDDRPLALGKVHQRTSESLPAKEAGRAVRQRSGREPHGMRVRLSSANTMESTPEEVGSLHFRPRAECQGHAVFRVEGKDAPASSRGITSILSMRLRPSGEASPVWSGPLLVGLPAWTSDAREARDSLTRGIGAHILSHAAAQSDVRSGHSQEGASDTTIGLLSIQDRDAISELVQEPQPADQFSGDGPPMGRSPEPGLPSDWTEEGNRDYRRRNLQRMDDRAENNSGLCDSNAAALRQERMGLSGDLLPTGSSASFTGGSTRSGAGLRIAGIELDRGMALQPINSIRPIPGRHRVYNFACPPIEAYIANGVTAHNCNFCAYRIEDYTETFAETRDDGTKNINPNRMIHRDKVIEILTDFRAMGGKAVQFTGGGEPTVHPAIVELLVYARTIGLDVALVTNAVKLDERVRRALLDEEPKAGKAMWTRISLDASNAKSYTKIRQVPAGHWEKALQNLRALVMERNAARAPLTIGVGFVVTRDNWREVAECAAIAKDIGVDNLRISAMFQPGDASYFDGFYADAAALCHEAEALTDGRFQVINNFGSRVADLELQSPDYKRCAYQEFTVYVGGDLNVYRCCVLSYTERGTVGSLKNQTLRELWETPERHQSYARFDARSCPRCQFNDKNRDINRIIDELPVMHGNFV